jgi:ELWxxDGT repeat protein
MMRRFYLALFFVVPVITNAQISLLRDINQGAATTGANPNSMIAMGGYVYYAASDGVRGTELWRTDGSTAGTSMVKDINPGESSYPDYMVVVGSTLYFTANDGENGYELWKSDGTAAGTVIVGDIYPGFTDSYPAYIVAINSTTLYFTATDEDHGNELFKLDITSGTISLVADINVGTASSYPYMLTLVSGTTIYFNADDGNTGAELWKSDGTAVGTTRVKDIFPGPNGSYPDYIVAVSGNTAVFQADDGTNGAEVWLSSGTSASTNMSANINPTAATGSYPVEFKVFGSYIYFGADNGTTGYELWRTNLSGTSPVSVDINASGHSYASGFTIVGSTMYFNAQDATNGYELWKTTSGGTPSVVTINSGTASGYPNNFTAAGVYVYFTATNALTGTEMYRYNGTTLNVFDMLPGTGSSNPRNYTQLGTNLIFSANDGTGHEVWKYTGSASPGLVLDAVSGSGGSYPDQFVYNGNGTTFFVADDGTGKEIWKTDGTTVGTTKLKDINAAAAGSSPDYLTMVGTTLYFKANDGTDTELWKSDGTTVGTVKVDVNPTGSSSPTSLFAFSNTTLLFSATNGTSGAELFKVVSGGTPTLVSDLYSGANGSTPTEFRVMGGLAYFRANHPSYGLELFRTNAAASSITLVKDIFAGTTGTAPSQLTVVGSYIYFRASGSLGNSANYELYRTDGTDAGTVLVKEIRSGTLTSNPQNLFAYNGNLYFTANDGVNGTEMYKSDPTAAIGSTNSVILFKDIVSGSGSSNPTSFYLFNGKLYFRATTVASGSEPWVTDGTVANTVLFKEIGPSGSHGGFSYPVTIGSNMFFVAKDNTGSNIWVTDGQQCRTIALSPFAGAATASAVFPALAGVGGSKLVFAMSAEGTDRELFIADPSQVVFPVAPGITTHPATQSITVGSPVTFSVVATGSGLSYQWQKNNVNINSATLANYTIAAVADTDAGDYKVIVTGTCGQLTSNPATLTANSTTPTSQPTALVLSNPTPNSLYVKFSAASGSPSGYLVLRKKGSAPTETPVDGTVYAVGATLGSSVVAAASSATEGADVGLDPVSEHFYAIFAYNGGGSLIKYLVVSPLTGSGFTLAAEPTEQPTGLTFSNIDGTTLSGSFAPAATATRYIVIRAAGAAPTSPPIDGTAHAAGNMIGDGVVAYVGDTPSFTDSNLTPETRYYYQVYSAKGPGPTVNYYTTSPLQNDVTTLASQPEAPTNLRFSNVTPNSFTIVFTPPAQAPAGYVVLRNAGTTLTGTPSDGATYTLGQTVGDARVAYVGANTTFDESLSLAQFTYSVFPYNGTGVSINYRQAAPLSGLIAPDDSAPVITDETPAASPSGSPIKIVASVAEPQSSIQEVKVEYRSVAAPGTATNTVVMVLNSGKYEFSVPATDIGDLGIEYTISATNTLSLTSTKTGKSALTFSNPTMTVGSFGTAVTNYRIVAVPLHLTSKTVADVFGDDLDTYDGIHWRMYRYDNGATTEMSSSSQIDVGKGYWLIIKDDKTIDTGPGTTTAVTSATPFEIDLKEGWNQIGNPYNFNIVWNDVLTESGLNLKLRVYVGGFTDGDKLAKNQGGFVLSNSAAKLKFPVKDNSAAGRTSGEPKLLTNAIDQGEWEVILNLKHGDTNNPFGGVGMNRSAKPLYDEFDDFTLPRFLDFVELNHDKKLLDISYTKDIVPTTENYTWEFKVESNSDGPTGITWDNSYFGISDKQIVLWDDEESIPVDMREASSYSFNLKGPKRFKVFYGSSQYVNEKSSKDKVLIHNISPNPSDREVNFTFTIPGVGKSQVEVRVLNSLGQPISPVFNGLLDGGYHQMSWSGKDINGLRPSQGVYLVEVMSNGQRLAKRVVLK